MQLRNEIRDCVQKPEEAYLKYSISVLSLMRRARGYSEEEKVEPLYYNLHPEYLWHIRRDVRTTRDLLVEVTECKQIQRRIKTEIVTKGATRKSQ